MDGIYHLNADIGQTDMDKAIFFYDLDDFRI